MRTSLFGMPYGDQALFVQRDTFKNVDGFRDIPLLEDVDLVSRWSPRAWCAMPSFVCAVCRR